MNKNITVIHFLYTLHGGVASVVANLINYQNKLGYRNFIVYKEYSDAFDKMAIFNCPKRQVKIPKIPGYSMLFGMDIKNIYREYCKEHPDEFVIIHVHNIQALGAFGKWKDIPLICTLHSLNGTEKTPRKMISNLLYYCALKRMIRYEKPITSVSQAIINEYAKFRGAEKISVIYNCTEIDIEKREVNPNYFNIGHVGNLSYAKGWDIIWEAYCLLPEDYKEKIHFYSAGNEADFTQAWIENEVEKHSLRDKVFYEGFVNDAKNTFIPKLDCLILASRNEGFGLVQVEAMGYGIPVIGRDVGGICEILKDNYNGFVISTCEELAEKIKIMVDDRNLYKKLSSNARETYLNGFNIETMALKYETIYKTIINTYCKL